MRKLGLVVGLFAVLGSGAQAWSYLDVFGTIHDPIYRTVGAGDVFVDPELLGDAVQGDQADSGLI